MSRKDKDKVKEKILNTIPIFLAKTYRIADNPAHHHIIEWASDGFGFNIKNVTELTEKIFPKYFKHGNYPSFVRQLNLYGFRKVRSAEQGQIFTHQNFSRDNPQLLSLIKRKTAQNQAQPSIQNREQDAVNLREQPISLAMMPANQGNNKSRETQLEGELMMLSEKHESLQNLVSILVQQNKQIILQNKNFINKIGKVDDNYRKKLQTLIFLMVFGLKNGGNNIIIPQHLSNMIRALTSKKKDKKSKNNIAAQKNTPENNALQVFKKPNDQGRFNNKKIQEILQMLEMESQNDDPAPEHNEEGQQQMENWQPQMSPIPSLRSYPSGLELIPNDDWQDMLRSIDHSDLLDFQDKL